MKAILISQEGREFQLQESELYSIGSVNHDNIFILHDDVAPHHVQLSYDMRKKAWQMTHQDLGQTHLVRHQKMETLRPLTPIYMQNNDLVILVYKSLMELIAPKNKCTGHQPYKFEDYEYYSAYPLLSTLYKPISSKHLDTNLPNLYRSLGYKIWFKESEDPYPKLKHPPEPMFETRRLKTILA